MNVIRDARYKYVHFTKLPPLFFDLERDPQEFENRAGDPAYLPLVLEYAQKMLSWRMNHDEQTLTPHRAFGPRPGPSRRAARLTMKLWQICLVAVVLALPLWCVGQPAMPDYPAHLASYHLIAGGASKFYHIEWAFLPNLAGEIVVPLLSRLVGLEFATRLFITAGLVLWVIGRR